MSPASSKKADNNVRLPLRTFSREGKAPESAHILSPVTYSTERIGARGSVLEEDLVNEKENQARPQKVEVESSPKDLRAADVAFSLLSHANGRHAITDGGDGKQLYADGCDGVEHEDDSSVSDLEADDEDEDDVEDVTIDMSKLVLIEEKMQVRQQLKNEVASPITHMHDKSVQARFAIRETPQSTAMQLASDVYAMRIREEAIKAFLGSSRIGRSGIDGVTMAQSRLRNAARKHKKRPDRLRRENGMRSRLGSMVSVPAAPFGSKA